MKEPIFYRETNFGPLLQFIRFKESEKSWLMHDVMLGTQKGFISEEKLDLGKISLHMHQFDEDNATEARKVLNFLRSTTN